MVQLLKHFPITPEAPAPRELQVKALTEFERIFSSGKKFVIARLPTGTGKTHTAVAVARAAAPISPKCRDLLESYAAFSQDAAGGWVNAHHFENGPAFGGVILTVSKSLQEQYLNTFSQQAIFKGKSNYCCDVDKNLTTDIAPCLTSKTLKKDCFASNRCPYYRARNNALIASDPVLNYRAYFSLPEFTQRRNHMVLDEADQLDSELLGHFTLDISYSQLIADGISFKKVVSDDEDLAGLWLGDLVVELKEAIRDTRQKLNLLNNKNTKADGHSFKMSQRLSRLSCLYSSVSTAVSLWRECEYMVESKDANGVVFVPFDIKPLARMLFNNADRILLMSATISDHEEFAAGLGIKKSDYEFVDIDSSFEAAKSPIYCSSKYSLSYKTMEANLPKVLDIVAKICEIHKDDKGIIHTHTSSITEAVKKKLGKKNRFLFREHGVTNEDIVKEHSEREAEPTVLVSPSLDTGISLDNELGRFQIIVKAPYMPLGSKRIKRMFDKNPKQYAMKMMDKLTQMCGRCTRSSEDHSVTYILDGSAVKAITSNSKKLPKYFLDRFM